MLPYIYTYMIYIQMCVYVCMYIYIYCMALILTFVLNANCLAVSTSMLQCVYVCHDADFAP